MADFPSIPCAVFISYSHQVAAYLARLQRYLAPYVRSGAIPLWDDTHIKPGDNWKQSIEQALSSARVALLLVSVDFLASEFVAKEELPRLLAAAEAQGTRILPVILTPCLFRRTSLSRFQAINDPVRPLSGLSQHEQDLVWERVVETVLETLEASMGGSLARELLHDAPAPASTSEPSKFRPASLLQSAHNCSTDGRRSSFPCIWDWPESHTLIHHEQKWHHASEYPIDWRKLHHAKRAGPFR